MYHYKKVFMPKCWKRSKLFVLSVLSKNCLEQEWGIIPAPVNLMA